MSQGSRVTIPSLSGPTLTRVLIPSVDPKLENCGRRKGVGGERREGSVQEPGLAGGASCSCWRDTRAQPPYTHPVQAGGRAACSLSWASRLLPASGASLRARAILGLSASQCAGRRYPCPQLHLPPSLACAHPTLGTLAILTAWPICTSPGFYPHTPLCTCLLSSALPLDPQSPPLHTHL